MLVDLDELSASELLELARKKQQQEAEKARAAAAAARLTQLHKRRAQLVADQERALAILEKELQALQQRRAQLIASHQSALAALDREIAEVGAGKDAAAEQSAAPPVATVPASVADEPAVSSRAQEGDNDKPDIAVAVQRLLKGRMDMSDSLLRERLRNDGYDVSRLDKVLERLVREGKVLNKGAGNYALRKRA